eukprot:SAG31_NODE_28642_length_407_cov_0.772727_1_plen_101_part_01
MIIFTVEYFLRLIASPDSPSLRGVDSGGKAMILHSISFYALVDLLAILPWYLGFIFSIVRQYDEYFRLIRIFRILKLDKYYPGISLIDDALRNAKDDLATA